MRKHYLFLSCSTEYYSIVKFSMLLGFRNRNNFSFFLSFLTIFRLAFSTENICLIKDKWDILGFLTENWWFFFVVAIYMTCEFLQQRQQPEVFRIKKKKKRKNNLITGYSYSSQCLGSGSVGSARFWLPGSGSASK